MDLGWSVFIDRIGESPHVNLLALLLFQRALRRRVGVGLVDVKLACERRDSHVVCGRADVRVQQRLELEGARGGVRDVQIGAQLVLGERDDICELKGAGVYRRDARVRLQSYHRGHASSQSPLQGERGSAGRTESHRDARVIVHNDGVERPHGVARESMLAELDVFRMLRGPEAGKDDGDAAAHGLGAV